MDAAQQRAEVARAGKRGTRLGVPNKWNTDIRTMMFEALHRAGGVQYLADRAIDTPGPFLTLLGRMMPATIAAPNGDSTTAMHLLAAQIISQQMLAQNAQRPVTISQERDDDRPVGVEERQRRLLEAEPPTE